MFQENCNEYGPASKRLRVDDVKDHALSDDVHHHADSRTSNESQLVRLCLDEIKELAQSLESIHSTSMYVS